MLGSEGNSKLCFLELRAQDSRENKTNWFPERPDIKYFVIFQDFHIKSHK